MVLRVIPQALPTLAALIDWCNEHSFGHIVTIEDPVEFIHPHKNCVVTQREVGEVTAFKEAMRKGRHEGMQTLDQCLADLVRRGLVAPAEARLRARAPESIPLS